MIIDLLIILLCFLLMVSIDLFPALWIWQSRIKIGKFTDNNTWKEKVLQKSISWLNNMPKTKIKDEGQLIIIDILKNQYTNKTLQSWQEAALVLGLNDAYKKTQDESIKTEILRFIHSKIDKNGDWQSPPHEVDTALLAFAFLETTFVDKNHIKPALDHIYQLILSKIGEEGTVMYRTSTKNYRYVDTIGFICPFLTKYGAEFKNEEAINLAILQIKNYVKFGMLENKIPCHAYEINSKFPVGIFGWGRGLAWFLIGLLETYKNLPQDHSDKKNLEQICKEMAFTLTQFQQANGGFSWSLLVENARIDSSATSVFAWFLKEMNQIEACEKAINYLKTVTQRSGAVDFSQGDTKSMGVYSQKFEILPFTQGFVLKMLFR